MVLSKSNDFSLDHTHTHTHTFAHTKLHTHTITHTHQIAHTPTQYTHTQKHQVTTGESEGMTGKGAKARASTESTLGRVTSSNSVDEGTDIVLCIVMELCPDGSLLEHLRRCGVQCY